MTATCAWYHDIMEQTEMTTSREYPMRLKLSDDYYEWYCEWCDTRNRTLWVRVHEDTANCAACQRTSRITD